MKRRRICLIASAVLLAAATMQGVTVPVPLPITLGISPDKPTSADTIVLSFSGIWPDTCTPSSLNVTVEDETVFVDMLLPGAGDCDEPNCDPVPTAFQINTDIGPLSPGSYIVSVRAISCDTVGDREFPGQFTVGFPAGGPGGLTQGACVVLLADNQPGLPGLQAGRNGTIVCSASEDPLGPFLVSWDFYHQGTHDARSCTSGTPVLSRPNSATLVDPRVVPLGTCFSVCGVVNARGSCILLQADDGQTYNVVDADGWLSEALSTSEIQFGARVRVEGLLSVVGPRPGVPAGCPREDGDIHEPIVTFCAPSGGGDGEGCCTANYKAGDRVVLLVDHPGGLEGEQPADLLAGALGTVVCCDRSDPNLPVFVSWDGFTEGSNTSFFCDPPIPSFPAGSGWWVGCDQITRVGNGGEPCANDKLTISFADVGIRINRDPQCPPSARPFSGCILVGIESPSAAKLSVQITPVPGMGGTWTATVSPDEIPAGNSVVEVCVEVNGIDLSKIPAGQDVKVADIVLNAQSL